MIILGKGAANERRRYNETLSHIGFQTKQEWYMYASSVYV